MKANLRCRHILLVLALLHVCVCSSQELRGTIRGLVRYHKGDKAPNIQVLVIVNNTQFKYHARTDEEGRYVVTGVPLGDVVLYPYDAWKLYPMRADMFLSKDPDRAVVDAEHLDTTKDLVLPEKAGVILGQVVADDGSAVKRAQVVLCHTTEVSRSAEIYTDDDGHFR